MDLYNSHNEPAVGEGESYWMSIGDLMSGLMFIFILALSAFMINITQLTDQLVSKENTRKQILHEIKTEMEAKGFTEIKIVDDQGILRLEQGILFDPGEAELLPEGKKLLNALAPITYQILNKPKYRGTVETIFIEGHTDNDPVVYSKEFDSNWDLSTQRAINTWLFMRNAESMLKSLKNKDGEKIISVSGYADSRPIASNKTEKGKRLNRRIDFRFNMVPPKSKDVKGPIKEIEQAVN